MKKYIIIITTLITITLGAFYFLNTEEKQIKIIVMEENHVHLYDKSERIEVTYFTNKEDYLKVDLYTRGSIKNKKGTMLFQLNGFLVTKIHDEYYNDELFYGYKLSFLLPNIEASYHMESVTLTLNTNHQKYEFNIGTIDILNEAIKAQFPFYSLEGTKREDKPTLDLIKVVTNRVYGIFDISIGSISLDFYYENNMLIIKVPKEFYHLTSTYVKITYEDIVSFLPHFQYFTNYELLIHGKYKMHLI